MVNTLTSLSRRELGRMVDRYPWFTTARRALALTTGEVDEALVLPLLFWPTVAPTAAAAPASASGDAAAAHEGIPVITDTAVGAAAAPVSPAASAAPAAPAASAADELIDRFISHGGYRITPDGDAADVRVDVEIAPEMVSPRLAEIYRAQGLVAEAERIEEILGRK